MKSFAGKPIRTAVPTLAAFLAFLAMVLSWSLGTPLLGGADEPEQTVKAAAVVRGEFSGTEHVLKLPGWKQHFTTPDYVEVSYWLPHDLVVALAKNEPACFAFSPNVTPRCTGKANRERIAQAGTHASSHMNYSPLYYLLVGWPSLLLSGDGALYGMRVVSALITAVLLTLAFVTSVRRRRAAAIGVVAALTPTAIYYGGVVNPNGLELCAALLVWVAFLSMVRAEPGSATYRRDGLLFVGASVLLLLTRPLSPVWLALIVALLLLTRADIRGWLGRVLRGPGVRAAGGSLVLATALAGAWDLTHNTEGIIVRYNPHFTARIGVSLTLQRTPKYLQQMVGMFGWDDVKPPEATMLLWYGAATAIVLAALALGNRRERLVLLALCALVFLFPIAFEAYSGAKYGTGWQGRYMLPLAMGLPVLGAEVLVRRLVEHGLAQAARSFAAVFGMTFVIGYGCEVWWAWRRYAVGLKSSTVHVIPLHASWSPPIGWPLTLLLAAAGCLGLFAVLRRNLAAGAEGTAAAGLPAPAGAARGSVFF